MVLSSSSSLFSSDETGWTLEPLGRDGPGFGEDPLDLCFVPLDDGFSLVEELFLVASDDFLLLWDFFFADSAKNSPTCLNTFSSVTARPLTTELMCRIDLFGLGSTEGACVSKNWAAVTDGVVMGEILLLGVGSKAELV